MSKTKAAVGDETQARERVLSAITANPKLSEAYDWVVDWHKRENGHGLRSRYELGAYVRAIFEDEEENDGEVYGRNATLNLAKALGGEDPGLLLAARRFADAFTPEQLDNLCNVRRGDGSCLNWSHARLLSSQPPGLREKLLTRCIEESWSSQRLQQEVIKAKPGGKTGDQGRKPVAPKNIKGLLEQVGTFTDKINRRAENWTEGASSPAYMVADMPAEQISDELISDLLAKRNATETAIQKLTQTKRELDKAIARAQRTLERVTQVAARKLNAAVLPEGDEEEGEEDEDETEDDGTPYVKSLVRAS